MNCSKCGKEITSPALTKELCTSCYFKAKKVELPVKALSEEVQPSIDESDKVLEPKLEIEEQIKHQPSKSLEAPENGKKYCQSCIERGYGLVLASHEWTPGYFICDDCFQPLINNIVQVERAEVERVKTDIKCDSPVLNQIYELLGLPEQLRFNSSEQVINSRNDIFNYHAQAIVNMNLDQVKERIEFLQTVLFNIRYAVDPYQDYINVEKAKARENAGLKGIEKSKKEVGKKVKLNDEEKMAKTLGMSVEAYRKAVAMAKEKTFTNIVEKK